MKKNDCKTLVLSAVLALIVSFVVASLPAAHGGGSGGIPTWAQSLGAANGSGAFNPNIASGQVLQWNADTGFSRLGAASVVLGNGTNGDTTGLLRGAGFGVNAAAGVAGTVTYAATAAPSLSLGLRYLDSARQSFVEHEGQSTANAVKVLKTGTLCTTTTTVLDSGSSSAVSMFGTLSGTKTLPANFLLVGKTIRITMHGWFTSQATPANLRWKVLAGATVLADSGSVVHVASQTGGAVIVEVLITCTVTGASGSLWTNGWCRCQGVSNNSNFPIVSTLAGASGAAVTVDTTATQVLDVTLTFVGGDASSTLTMTNAVVEAIN